MPKIKPHRSSPTLDMTAMTDVAFLLLTFFMLTAKMKQSEPIQVDTPSSVSETKVPENDIMVISVDRDNRVFLSMDNQTARRTLIERMNSLYNVGLSEEEMKNFELTPSSFGLPLVNLKEALKLPLSDREQYQLKFNGIPCDTVDNQLANWVYQARYSYAENSRRVHVILKADSDAKYPVIQQVLGTLRAQDINAFNLITDLEGTKAAEEPGGAQPQ
jgi:biopolymer transport protein ExbD